MQGQNLRLFINEKVIAGATDCTVHVAATLEDNSTKDETGGAPSQEFVGYTYDLSSDSIFAVDGSLEMLSTLLAGVPVKFDFEQTNGEKNQNKVKTLVSGKVLLNDASFKATNKQRATASFQGQGVGPLSVNGVEIGTVPPDSGS
jgi:hypothetical protein